MGHTEERTRGDSRLRDWPDVEWRVMRKDDDPASARYFTAYGRDVDVAEQQLGYDVPTRRLTIVGGSRKNQAVNTALSVVLQFVKGENDKGVTPSQNEIVEGLKGGDNAKKVIVAAIKRGIKIGRITTTDGPRHAKLHTVLELRNTVDVTFEEVTLLNDEGQSVLSVLATCTRCQHTTEAWGVKEPSRKRCLAVMGKECPQGEKNFYIEIKDVISCPGASLMEIVPVNAGLRVRYPGCGNVRIYGGEQPDDFVHEDGCSVYARIKKAMRLYERKIVRHC
jgi:hypothetical protein